MMKDKKITLLGGKDVCITPSLFLLSFEGINGELANHNFHSHLIMYFSFYYCALNRFRFCPYYNYYLQWWGCCM